MVTSSNGGPPTHTQAGTPPCGSQGGVGGLHASLTSSSRLPASSSERPLFNPLHTHTLRPVSAGLWGGPRERKGESVELGLTHAGLCPGCFWPSAPSPGGRSTDGSPAERTELWRLSAQKLCVGPNLRFSLSYHRTAVWPRITDITVPGIREDLAGQALGLEHVGDEPDLGISQARFKSKLHSGLANWPWANYFISLCFGFPVYSVGVIMIFS